jgi:transcriptional regulator with GAF, ATPase, and Fis domain
LEPLPETREALGEYVSLDDPDPEQLLAHLEEVAGRIVPELVGLSLALAGEQLTFTLVASDSEIAALDAVQYLDGGPCLEVGEGRSGMEEFRSDDPLDEKRWRLFSQATSARGVASTLSLPLYVDEQLVGSVNLYAATATAFETHIEELAALVGAAPAEVVSNADLSFVTRLEAMAAPQRLRDHQIIETAVGLIAGDKGIDLDGARHELADAAARAGTHLANLARVVISIYIGHDG